MIEFEHKLPSARNGEERCGTYNNYELAIPGILTSKDSRLGEFMYSLRKIVMADRRLVFVDGKKLCCCINWIRDHVHDMKAFKHWEYDIGSFLNFIIDTQSEEGFFFELLKQYDDRHWSFVNEDCRVIYPDDNMTLVRLELEADIEYLVVEGAVNYYRVTGDKKWVEKVLPKLEKGIDYITSSRKRWDDEYGLVKRPFTIDTWDFTFGKSGLNRRIEENDPMCIMHGDNSGVYAAMNSLAYFNRLLGCEQKAQEWENRADKLCQNMIKHLWNGNFFVHQLHLNPEFDDGLEAKRISLSNTYDINRGVTTTEMARTIIEEYMRRREETNAFAEWFSIDPPYERFNDYPKGQYVNGSISPFTAGELAKAAFNNGYEEYGYDIIRRLMEMCERDDGIFFLYSPKDAQPQGRGPSAWGAAAILSAIDEGLAGIVDKSCLYEHIMFSPRFTVTDYKELRYITGYEKSDVVVDVRYILKDVGMRYDVISPANKLDCHILLPGGKHCEQLYVNGEQAMFSVAHIGESVYVDFDYTVPNAAAENNRVSIEIIF